jgi:hypothetical protein
MNGPKFTSKFARAWKCPGLKRGLGPLKLSYIFLVLNLLLALIV